MPFYNSRVAVQAMLPSQLFWNENFFRLIFLLFVFELSSYLQLS